MIDHSNCDHDRTPSARAACRRRLKGSKVKGPSLATRTVREVFRQGPSPALPEVWSYAKIRQEARRRTSTWQSTHPLDPRSFAEIMFGIHADLRDRYAR